MTQVRRRCEVHEDEDKSLSITFLWPGCAAVALGEGSEGVSSSVQVLAACCPSPCERECGHQAPAVKFSHQRGPDPLPGVAQPALDLLGLGFGGLSPKVGLTRRGAVSPSATPVMQHELPCIVRGQEWQNPSFVSQGSEFKVSLGPAMCCSLL